MVIIASFVFALSSPLETPVISKEELIIKNCTGKETCPGRIEALEKLVKSRRLGIDLSDANLQGANLSNGWFNDQHGFPSWFDNVNLSNANLSKASLQEAQFNGANLSNINLSDAYITYAQFSGANLTNANLSNANLNNSNLANANLSGANLYNAKLAHIENLTASQIKSACNWEKAIYFDGYDEDEEQIMRIKQLKEDKDSNPEKPVDCSHWQQQSKHWLEKLLDFSR